jgi:hypothetical protein
MKRFLLLTALLGISYGALAEDALSLDPVLPGMPAVVMVANIPMGSGYPALGQSVGYSVAEATSDGLYHVPNFFPTVQGVVWTDVITPRVVDVACVAHNDGLWYCDGYHVDHVLERGDFILVRPHLVTKPAPEPVVAISSVPTPEVVDPVTPVKKHFIRRKPKPPLVCSVKG